MSIAWPATLPEQPQAVDEDFLPNRVEHEPDGGPKKRRRRWTKDLRTYSVRTSLTAAQKTTLQTFYETTTLSGSLSFDWMDPRTGLPKAVHFSAPPSFSANGPEYTASFTLIGDT